jgi:two-component system sensor histidine kinase/response regulator
MIKKRILLIDDDLNIRETLCQIFSFKNYEFKSAVNGKEALELLDNWMPDLILCDLMMPVMDGFVFHETVKEINSLSAIPFVFLTAKKENDLMRKCLLNGADDFIVKPFKINELIDIVETKIARFKQIKKAYNTLHIGKKII